MGEYMAMERVSGLARQVFYFKFQLITVFKSSLWANNVLIINKLYEVL